MEIEIRKARVEDTGPMAQLMYSSGTDVYDYLYQEHAIAYLQHEFETGKSFAGFNNVTVAVIEGEVVATGCFYDGKAFLQLLAEGAENKQTFFKEQTLQHLYARAKHMGSIMCAPREDELYLSNFGVTPHLRGKGIGRYMLEHQIKKARQDGYAIFSLDVSSNNPKGQALYERMGLSVIEEKTFSDPEAGINPARKMELVL
ncbi:hypothetical protein NBRC116188_22170 [Oceaniserpentilla sp. 4NH20-0058]|uniref:GNAT family N-acetyltransferase n=1 Tax=Oceaniserpentilla sp. 4NH20-0058 TaxID=3127660 RepID=UPI0031085FF9